MKKRLKKGYILALTIVLCSVMFFYLLFGGADIESFSMLNESQNRQLTEDAADGAQASAIARIIYSPGWDDGFKADKLSFTGAEASITFDKKSKKPYSTNNFMNPSPTKGWNSRQIPPGYIHLVVNAQSDQFSAPKKPTVSMIREALVNPYYLLYFENFNANGKGNMAKWKWNYKGKGHVIEDSFLFMGSTNPDHNQEQFASSGHDWWTDFDLKANLVYYGQNAFDILFRIDEGYEGLAMRVIPAISGDKIVGAEIQVCKVTYNGEAFEGIDFQTILEKGNAFETKKLPAFWDLKVSVEGKKAWLSVNDEKVTKKFDLTKRGPSISSKGEIGFHTEPGAEIGVTNVTVDKRGTAMISITSQW